MPSCGLPFHSVLLLWQPIGQPGNAAISPADHILLNVLSFLIIKCTDDIRDVHRVATNQISPYWSQLTYDFWLLWVTALCTSHLLGPGSFFICSASSLQQGGLGRILLFQFMGTGSKFCTSTQTRCCRTTYVYRSRG